MARAFFGVRRDARFTSNRGEILALLSPLMLKPILH